MENPGQRRSISLMPTAPIPSVKSEPREISKSTNTSVTGNTGRSVSVCLPQVESQNKRDGSRQRVSVPTISVNDKPISSRKSIARASSSRKPSQSKPSEKDDHDRHALHHHARHTGAPDFTNASTGMFSECMFYTSSQKPTRHSPSSTASSSSTSLYAHGGLKNGNNFDPLKRNSVKADPSNIITNAQNEIDQHRHPLHRHHRHHNNSSKLHNKPQLQRSFSSVYVNDNKRLVNQFLRSMEPPSSTPHLPKTNTQSSGMFSAESDVPLDQEANLDDYDPYAHGSLQGVLYRDLGSSQKKNKHTNVPPVAPFMIPTSSSSSSISSSLSVLPGDASPSSSSSFESSVITPSSAYEKDEESSSNMGVKNGVSLNYNEVNYYRRHIHAQLHKFEDILKHSLKEVIVKNECDMQKNLKNFDSLTAELTRLKQDATNLNDLIKYKYLVSLRKDFNTNDKQSFISDLSANVEENVGQLKDLEKRMDVCKIRLSQQRDSLRKMESLLTLEDTLLDSQKTTKLAYKYRYMVFDLGAFIGIICLALLFKWLLWK